MKNVKNIKKNGGTSMNLKRITALLAALALAASMAACQKAPAEPDATPSDSSAASSTAEESEKPSAATGTRGSTASSGKNTAPADEPTESSENGQKETTPGSSSGSEKPTSGSQKPTEKPQQPTEKPSTGSKPPESSKPSESAKPTEPKPTAHQHNYKTTTVAATCTTGGYTLHECACGASYKDGQTAALGHSYVDTVVAPTTSSQGYTEHTCSRCGDSYKDSYTDPVRWDTEEVVARICAQGNEYVRSLGLTVDPSVGSWVAPESTTGWFPDGVNPEVWLLQRVKEEIDGHANNPIQKKTRFNVTYGPKDGGGWYIYVMYGL